MTDTYDPSAVNQHAQLLFDNWKEGELPDLYEWLSRKNIDANKHPHDQIREAYIMDHAEDEG